MSVTEFGPAAHVATCLKAEGVRQTAETAALAALVAGGTPTVYRAVVRSAVASDYKTRIAPALATGAQPGPFFDGLRTVLGTYYY
jgi:hypothetical protein